MKILILFFFFMSLNSCRFGKSELQYKLGLSYSPSFLVGCEIYDADFNLLKTLPGGAFCLPLEDGSWLASDSNRIALYSDTGKIMWQEPGFFHHNFILDSEGNFIVLGSDFKKINKLSVRADVVKKISRSGRTLAEFNVFDHLDDFENIKNPKLYKSFFPATIFKSSSFDYDLELSHINSVQDVNHQYLIGDPYVGACFILDQNLKLTPVKYDLDATVYPDEFLKPPFRKPSPFLAHTCRLNDKNELVYYSNRYSFEGHNSFAVIKKTKDKTEVLFPKRKDDIIAADWGGGVQLVGESGDHMVVTTLSRLDIYIDVVDHDGHTIFRKKIKKPLIEAELKDLSGFLKNNKI
ncbi:MAG: hypothetical protein ACXVAX_06730 [Pseudobdellovibrio sp.]